MESNAQDVDATRQSVDGVILDNNNDVGHRCWDWAVASSLPTGFVVKECDVTIDHDGSGFFTYLSMDGQKFVREMQENERQSVRAHVGTHLADWLTESGVFVRN